MIREWDGVCVCGKVEADGKRCRFGATHAAKAISLDDDDDLDFLTTDDDLDFLTTDDDLDFLN